MRAMLCVPGVRIVGILRLNDERRLLHRKTRLFLVARVVTLAGNATTAMSEEISPEVVQRKLRRLRLSLRLLHLLRLLAL